MAEEEEEHDGDEHGAGEQRATEVRDRVLDEARLTEQPAVDRDAGGEDARERVERFLGAVRDGDDVHFRLLGDQEKHARLAVHDRIADRDAGALGDVRDGADRDRPAVTRRQRRARDVGGIAQAPIEPADEALTRAVEISRARGRIRGRDCGCEIVDGGAGMPAAPAWW